MGLIKKWSLGRESHAVSLYHILIYACNCMGIKMLLFDAVQLRAEGK